MFASRRAVILLNLLALLYSATVSIYILAATFNERGATDFHSYWYAGHFVRQGRDPYQAYFQKDEPEGPIAYADGMVIRTLPVAQANLAILPANTAPLVLLLSLFAYFSWPVAKGLWLVLNLFLALKVLQLVLTLTPFPGIRLETTTQILIGLSFYNLSATRIAVENGQTTLLVFFLMLMALVFTNKSSLASGIFLGLALSKYSLALPVFLFLLYRRRFSTLVVALLLQVAGLLCLSALTKSPPTQIMWEYVRVLLVHSEKHGVHLASLFPVANIYTMPIALIGTLAVFWLVGGWLSDRQRLRTLPRNVVDLHLFAILALWTLLVAYHALYDTVIALFFVVLVSRGLRAPDLWGLSGFAKNALIAFLGVSMVVMTVPGKIVDIIVPGYNSTMLPSIIAGVLIVMLICSMGLLYRAIYQSTPLATLQYSGMGQD